MEHMQIHDCVECELCTFVCPSKIAIGQHIKDGKDFIKKDLMKKVSGKYQFNYCFVPYKKFIYILKGVLTQKGVVTAIA